MKRRVWRNIVKRLHIFPSEQYQIENDEKKGNFHIVDHIMDEKSKNFTELDVESLKDELKKALSEENYEEAARIRDLINKLGL